MWGIGIIVYSCTGYGTSKIYLCLEDNGSSFSQVSLKSKTKDAHPQTAVLFCLPKIWFLENKNLTSNKLKMRKLMFNVKQLKMNTFIKYIIGNWLLVPPMLRLRYPRYAPDNNIKMLLPKLQNKARFKACVRYFLSNFYFFTKRQPFKNCKKCFLFHQKSSFCSRDTQIFVIFSLPSTLSRLKRENGSGIIYDVINWLA